VTGVEEDSQPVGWIDGAAAGPGEVLGVIEVAVGVGYEGEETTATRVTNNATNSGEFYSA
jgi:hypothetical protein